LRHTGIAGRHLEMRPSDLTDATLPRFLQEAQQPVVLVFHSRGSKPARTTLPLLGELAADYEGVMQFALADVEQARESLDTYGILSLPTYLIFKQGRQVDRFIGLLTKEKLRERLEASLREV
jgi:thioredoxin 1